MKVRVTLDVEVDIDSYASHYRLMSQSDACDDISRRARDNVWNGLGAEYFVKGVKVADDNELSVYQLRVLRQRILDSLA